MKTGERRLRAFDFSGLPAKFPGFVIIAKRDVVVIKKW